MAEVIKTTFLLRRGYEAAWEKNNPILACGEPGFVIDKNILKIGDGRTPWKELKQINPDIIFNGKTHLDFPLVGRSDVIYKAEDEKALYQWNNEKTIYEPLTSGDSIDLSKYATIEQTKQLVQEAIASVENGKYEIFDEPIGTLIHATNEEIRIMCPNTTNWILQDNNVNNDPNIYYIGIRFYAQDTNIFGFKRGLGESITDQTIYYFENNSQAGIDENGRKYNILYLPIATYNPNNDEWNYHGSTSTTKNYVGWFYNIEWYDVNNNLIDSDCIRINLSNENCHNFPKPYYMGAINTNLLVQNENDYLILYGGSATDNI